MNRPGPLWIVASLIALLTVRAQNSGTNSFINFETAPVHPIAVSPDGRTLAICNLPAGTVELYELGEDAPARIATVPVGIDPVTARFRTTNELWVVNQISDSINIIDVARRSVTGLLQTKDTPSDVIFTHDPDRAFITCTAENLVMVFDVGSGQLLEPLQIEGERPRALAASPDGTKVYAAILESGNGTTIIAPRFTGLGHHPPAGPADLAFGPHGGMNPPPNLGTNFFPEISTNLAEHAPPRVSLIVKRDAAGRWFDDNGGDWTEFVSGTNAAFSGRIEGWELLDHDLAVIDARALSVSYIDGLMNICTDVAVNPATGSLAVIGTEALNHLRYEPVLQSIFVRAHLALVSPDGSGREIKDLNPHLDYTTRNIPLAERKQSVGDPRAALWDASGERLFVAGMGSANLAVFDRNGARTGFVELPDGPSGLALDPEGRRLYILSRFAARVTVLDSATLATTHTIELFDPTPTAIRKGRNHFYNTVKTSGLGQASCASCHVDGRMDRLAWDLGTQIGAMKMLGTNHNFAAIPPAATNHFHPMKGPMVTQTLQDIIGHEPFHWRGDRDGLEEFNPTFKELQGADEELTEEEMQEFEDFLATIHFPPNRFRTFDNTLPQRVPLPGEFALGRGNRFKGDPMPDGNAQTGVNIFRSAIATCAQCHTIPAGLGTDRTFLRSWRPIPPGPKGERHLALAAVERSDLLPFKVPHLRNLAEKLGFNSRGPSRSGFGFLHDGRVDTLTRFIQDGFDITDDQGTADLVAFLLAFRGSDLGPAPNPFDVDNPPGDFSRDAPAALGRQILAAGDSLEVRLFLQRASAANSRLDLIAKGMLDGQPHGWLWHPASARFIADRGGETLSPDDLLGLASPGEPLVFTLAARGTGERLGIDRDEDGVLDGDEPATLNAASSSLRVTATLRPGGMVQLAWNSEPGRRYVVLGAPNIPGQWRDLASVQAAGVTARHQEPIAGAMFFRVTRLEEEP